MSDKKIRTVEELDREQKEIYIRDTKLRIEETELRMEEAKLRIKEKIRQVSNDRIEQARRNFEVLSKMKVESASGDLTNKIDDAMKKNITIMNEVEKLK